MSTTTPDATLDALREHDPDAWEALYRRVYPRLFGYARKRVTTAQQAEDAVSETLVRAMDKVATYRPGGAGVDGWLFGICRMVLLESFRAARRQQPAEPQWVGELAGGTDDDPSVAVLAAEDRHRVAQAFARLSETDQELLEMRVVVGLDAAQVAALTGRKAGAVRTAQSRALARLRAEMEGQDR